MFRTRQIAGALVVILALAGCGSSNSAATLPASAPTVVTGASTTAAPALTDSSGVTTTVGTVATATETQARSAPAPVTTQTITNPSSGGAGLTPTAPVAAAAASLCVAADLHVAAVPPNSAPGVSVVGLTIANVSGHPCRTGGWPGVAFIDTGGGVLATDAVRATADELGDAPNRPLDLAPGQTASFRVTVKRAGTGADCAVAAVQVIAPDDTVAQRTAIPDGPLELCGPATVIPLQAGAAGTGQ